MEKVKGFMVSPSATFDGVRDEGWGASYGFYAKLLVIFAILFIIMLVAFGWWVISMIFGFFTSMLAAFGVPAEVIPIDIQGLAGMVLGIMAVVMFISTIIGGLIGILIGSGWMHIWVYLCGGRKGVGQTIKAMAYGSTPSLLLGWVPFIGVIFGVWSMVVSIIGLRQLHEISTGRAVLAYLLGAIIIPLIVTLIILLI
ncbi:MAG: YIP1 family protein [Candidatus Bathyarchaeia archaeon]